jgi:hypothetical protein
MTPEEGSAIISWAASAVPQSVFVTYEQVGHTVFKQRAQNTENTQITVTE